MIEPEPESTMPVSHTLVWVAAFVPLAGLLLDLWLFGASSWWAILLVLGFNTLILKMDRVALRQRLHDTEPLDSFWGHFLVPVYMFKRVAVAGGGYGYAVTWMATFSILLLFPFIQQNGALGPVSGSAGVEVYCQVGLVADNCTFTNPNSRSGATMCVRVIVENRRTVRSETVCSGPLQEFDSVQKSVVFLGEQPADICIGGDLLATWDECDVTIIEQ